MLLPFVVLLSCLGYANYVSPAFLVFGVDSGYEHHLSLKEIHSNVLSKAYTN
jgi:hypothetical protein